MLFLSTFWIIFIRRIKFSLSHESFPSIGWTFPVIKIKQSSFKKPFLSTVMSAFLEIGTLMPVYDVSLIFVVFFSGFLFIFLKI